MAYRCGVEQRGKAPDELLAEARAALRGGDADAARRLLDTARAEFPDDADVYAGLARAAYLALDFSAAAD